MILIGFSADIGYIIGDAKEHCRFLLPPLDSLFLFHNYEILRFKNTHLCKCSSYKGTRTRAAIVFIFGFWLLDLANNTVQVKAC